MLAQLYLDEGAKVGVRGDVAFAQSILETGGFAHPGSSADNNNFAGIGWCDSCKHGFDFPDAQTGVRAQVQLLRTYVDPDFPDANYKDKLLLPGTLRLGFRGKVQTWWDLWGIPLPFGIIALSSMALASNLTFVGIYFTALSIAKETNLRVQITQKVKQLAVLGDLLGSAQIQKDLLRQVKPIVEKHLEKVDEIPTSLEDEDIQLFVKQALREIKKRE